MMMQPKNHPYDERTINEVLYCVHSMHFGGVPCCAAFEVVVLQFAKMRFTSDDEKEKDGV